MNRRIPLLFISHAFAFGAMWIVAKQASEGTGIATAGHNASPHDVGPGAATKVSRRHPAGFDHDRGKRLLDEFRKDAIATKPEPDFDSKYAELKASLPVASDVKAAALEEIRKLDRPVFFTPSEQQRWNRLAKVEVRVLHWMQRDPIGAMEFLAKDDISFRHSLISDFNRHVFKDLIAEKGLEASVPWLSKALPTSRTFCEGVVKELKAGGGVALLQRLQTTMLSDPGQAAYLARISSAQNVWGRMGVPFFFEAAGALPFEQRDALMELVNQQAKETDQSDLLRGFARSGPEAAAWLLERIGSGELQGTVAGQVKAESVAAIEKNAAASMDLRVGALARTPAHAGKPPEDLIAELLGNDVAGVLKDGRDWRYEFRHGVASADEVLAAMRAALPGAAGADDAGLREALFRQLVEENPEQARSLIDGLPAEKRRAIEYEVVQSGFSNVSPEMFTRYLATVPSAATPEEERLRSEGMKSKAAGYTSRFGDNYEQAVSAMPAGTDRDAAVKGVVDEARQKNPVQASEVEKRLVPEES